MRATNKATHGRNWTVRQLKERTQLTMKLEDGSKPSVLTEIPWQPDKATEILNAVQEIRSFVEAGESIQEANQKRLKALGKESGKAPALRKFDWSAAADAFLESMEGRRGGTLADLKIRVRRFKLTIKSKPAPTDGPSLMRAFGWTIKPKEPDAPFPFEKSFDIEGPKGSGKGVIAETLTALCGGTHGVTTLRPVMIGCPDSMQGLQGKKTAIDFDSSGVDRDPGQFNSIVSNEPVQVWRKFQNRADARL